MKFDLAVGQDKELTLEKLFDQDAFLMPEEDHYVEFVAAINKLREKARITGESQMYDSGISGVVYLLFPSGNLGVYAPTESYTLKCSYDVKAAAEEPERAGVQVEVIREDGTTVLSSLINNKEAEEFARMYAGEKMKVWRVHGSTRKETSPYWFELIQQK